MYGEKMTVIEYIDLLSDGGAQRLIVDYVKYLNSDKFEVLVVATRRREETANTQRLCEMGIEIAYIYPEWNRITRWIDNVLGSVVRPLRLRHILRKTRANVLHIHSQELCIVERIKEYISKNNIKVFYTCHSIPMYYFEGRYSNEKPAALNLIKYCDMKIIALHNELNDILRKYFNTSNVVTIRNGVDYDWINCVEESKKDIKESLRIPEKMVVLGTVGRLVIEKQTLFLVDIFNSFRKYCENSKLLIIGTGPLENEIKKKIVELKLENDCILLSHRTDVNRLLKAMDVFVFPSYNEGFPLTVIEAQVSNIKCAISDDLAKDIKITDNLKFLPLSESAEYWAKEIHYNLMNVPLVSDCSDELDIKNIVNQLEKLYIS